MIIWVIGLSGAGKTTIGQRLFERLQENRPNTVFLDGDIFRKIMGSDLGFSAADREKSAMRYHNLCQLLDSQNINVVCCILANQANIQRLNREHFQQYFEIYIDVSMDTLIQRDPKGLYRGALKGEVKNVVGMDIPFHPPQTPDYRIDNNEFVDLERVVNDILEQLSPLKEAEGVSDEKVETVKSIN